MSNNNANLQLLYAILRQKCLKDASLTTPLIDWNKVAHDPILDHEITNGHAARMRYSRFKKQMDGSSAVRKPRNPASPRKKVEKKPKKEKGKAKKEESDDASEGKIKEEVGVAGSSHHTPAPKAGLQLDGPHGSFQGGSSLFAHVKREPGSSSASYHATTPGEASTPASASSFNGADDMSEIEDIYASFGEQQSFGLPGPHEYMSNGILGQGSMQQQYGMGFHMGIDPYHAMWEHLETAGEDGAAVKRESRWEQAYRH